MKKMETNEKPNNNDLLNYSKFSTSISFVLSLSFMIIATFLYPNFNWIYNSLSQLGALPEGGRSISFSSGSLLVTCLGNLPLITFHIKKAINNYNRMKILADIFLLLSTAMIGFEAIIDISWFDLHLLGAQVGLISLFFVLGFLIIKELGKNGNKKYTVIYILLILILATIWLFFINIIPLNPMVSYAIPEISTFLIYYGILFTFIYKLKN
jgi:hypothetical membrane protein